MRNISFAETLDQVRSKQKTVTRRLGWEWLKPGTHLRPVEKAMGLQKGESITPIFDEMVIRVVDVRREPLSSITDCDRPCEHCDGSGFVIVHCARCNGAGEVEGWCLNCHGSGCHFCFDTGFDEYTCRACDGDPRAACEAPACYQGVTNAETTAEGFPGMPGDEFVDFFCHAMGCKPDDDVTRIEFEYTPHPQPTLFGEVRR